MTLKASVGESRMTFRYKWMSSNHTIVDIAEDGKSIVIRFPKALIVHKNVFKDKKWVLTKKSDDLFVLHPKDVDF